MSAATVIRIPNNAAIRGFEMVGFDNGLQGVWNDLNTVSVTDSTVLIHGETGTGKELVARAIHENSRRANGPFVKVNCAAIPASLLESELFGHERGAFTGAVAQTVGRFQLAHGGTLFLDEVGELPLELQPKLLRVLQEREFERVGSARTIRTDVRIVAATNQDLQRMVRENRFRIDLFYRLNVFPILLPPLRKRRADIPLLVDHFVREYASRMMKKVFRVPEHALAMMCQYDWPGNVRELQNFIERAMIRSSGPTLEVPLHELASCATENTPTRTLAEAEREHILGVLSKTNGVIAGPHGAAKCLGLPRTTLLYRMGKLGITQSRSLRAGRLNRGYNERPNSCRASDSPTLDVEKSDAQRVN